VARFPAAQPPDVALPDFSAAEEKPANAQSGG
jgi:hypothetical protein